MVPVIDFEFPWGWLLVLPLLLAIGYAAFRQRRRGVSPRRVWLLAVLRSAALLPLVFLATRPVMVGQQPLAARTRPVIVLMDRSESMSLQDRGQSRYLQALDFLRGQLLPGLKAAAVPVEGMLFDQTAQQADGERVAAVRPDGKGTDLGAAIAQALSAAPEPPLAIVALTDGAANRSKDNSRAAMQLAEDRVPFIGVGFGSDQGLQTLSLRELETPASAPPKTAFNIGAHLELMNAQDLPGFDLVLLRDGQIVQRKKVDPGRGSRVWRESFAVKEDVPGAHQYGVQLLPPSVEGLRCINSVASASVRISEEKELRVLYIQGALTWDYKFIYQALRPDRSIQLTGLTRTSEQSMFRQNVETAGELVRGFPESLEEFAPYRVVVLSNLRPADLTAAQQELLARFCGELGGGVLMIGGAATFDASWHGSRLEQLLPVVFASNPGVAGLDQPFRLQLTEEALRSPVFQIADTQPNREAWTQLPDFTQYARFDAPKPGAEVWMHHPTEAGPHGKRILMAVQRYGAGLSAVLSIQNFWRWRLAKETDPQRFDRFWRQLFRFLSEVGRQEVTINLADQELRPQADVRLLIEKQPNPQNLARTNRQFVVRVENAGKELLREELLELEPLQPIEIEFHASKADAYTVTVLDSTRSPVTSRAIEIRDIDVEMQNTARNMENLRQWAGVSGGLAFKAEECPPVTGLLAQIRGKAQAEQEQKQVREISGLNGWTLAFVLACLAGEWTLRKKWGLA